MKSQVTLELEELLQLCLENDRVAQKQLYEKFGPLMRVVCRRYLFDSSMVDEVMNRGFLKVFTKLSTFKGEGSFEGWVRKIMVRESLNNNAKSRVNYGLDENAEDQFLKQNAEADENADLDFILKIIAALPIGYRTIFNLIEIEGYTHDEVALQLKITEVTSRSQLSRAKKLLRKKLSHIDGL